MLEIHNTSTPVVEERRKREGVGQGGKESEKKEKGKGGGSQTKEKNAVIYISHQGSSFLRRHTNPLGPRPPTFFPYHKTPDCPVAAG